VLKKINKKYHCSNFFLCQKLKSRVSFIQLNSVLDIFLRGFILSSCSQHSPLAPKSHVSFKVMYSTVNSIFHISIRIKRNRISESLLYTEKWTTHFMANMFFLVSLRVFEIIKLKWANPPDVSVLYSSRSYTSQFQNWTAGLQQLRTNPNNGSCRFLTACRPSARPVPT
jgi:hypothetical protein